MKNNRIQTIKKFYSINNKTIGKICGVDKETVDEWSETPSDEVKDARYSKVLELFQITRDVNPSLDKKLFWHYVVHPLKEHSLDKSNRDSLIDMFVKEKSLDTMRIKALVQLAYDKTLEREESIKARKMKEFDIHHTEKEMDYNLELNLSELGI